jgi:hypothetical protein
MKLAECLAMKDIVFSLDDRIRYFGFLDNRGGMVISELRHKDSSHHPEEQLVRDLTFFKGAMSSWAIYFGHVKYSVVVHESFKIVMVPVESGLVIITTEASFPVQSIESISQKVNEEISTFGKL